MSTQVKVCGITRLEDAKHALDLGADYLGINLFKGSPRSVPLERVPELLEAIPVGKRVLVDVSTPTDLLDQYLDLGFDYYQIHFDLNIAIATVAAWSGLVGRERLWLAPRVPPGDVSFPQIIMEFADTFVFDTFSKTSFGGTGRKGDWQRFLDWTTLYQHKSWILAGGLGPENITEALRVTAPAVIDVNSRVESGPGLKDEAKLEDLFEKVRAFDKLGQV